MPPVVAATGAPLFDRLTLREEGTVDGSLLDAGGLRLSLRREVERLFNTRCSRTIDEYLEGELSVIDFGLPDFSHLSVQSESDRSRLALVIHKALSAFEPRLSSVQVEVEPRERNGTRASIQAAVKLGREMRRVDFELASKNQGGPWSI